MSINVSLWCFFRLAKAEDDHQIAIAEKLDLEARLNEEIQISKVFFIKSQLAYCMYSYKPRNVLECSAKTWWYYSILNWSDKSESWGKAQNNGWSTDNVHPKWWLDQPKTWLVLNVIFYSWLIKSVTSRRISSHIIHILLFRLKVFVQNSFWALSCEAKLSLIPP